MISDAAEELPQFVELMLGESSLDYRLGSLIWYKNTEWVVERIEPKQRIVLRRRDP